MALNHTVSIYIPNFIKNMKLEIEFPTKFLKGVLKNLNFLCPIINLSEFLEYNFKILLISLIEC